jgi:hypothetical protein
LNGLALVSSQGALKQLLLEKRQYSQFIFSLAKQTLSGTFPVTLPAASTVGELKAWLETKSALFAARHQRLMILDAASGTFVRLDQEDARALTSFGVTSATIIDLLIECSDEVGATHQCPSLFPLSVANGRFDTPDPAPYRQVLEMDDPSLPPRVRAWRNGDSEPDVLNWTRRARGMQLPCLHERFPTLLFALQVDGCGDWDLSINVLPRTAERSREIFEAEMRAAHSCLRRRDVCEEIESAALGSVWTEFPLMGDSSGIFLTVESVEHAYERLLEKRGLNQKKGSAASSSVDENRVLTYCVGEYGERRALLDQCRRIDINLTTGELEPHFDLDELTPGEWEIREFLRSDITSSAAAQPRSLNALLAESRYACIAQPVSWSVIFSFLFFDSSVRVCGAGQRALVCVHCRR